MNFDDGKKTLNIFLTLILFMLFCSQQTRQASGIRTMLTTGGFLFFRVTE